MRTYSASFSSHPRSLMILAFVGLFHRSSSIIIHPSSIHPRFLTQNPTRISHVLSHHIPYSSPPSFDQKTSFSSPYTISPFRAHPDHLHPTPSHPLPSNPQPPNHKKETEKKTHSLIFSVILTISTDFASPLLHFSLSLLSISPFAFSFYLSFLEKPTL